MELTITDRGSHIEVVIGVSGFDRAEFFDMLTRESDRLGRKPILVVCDDPHRELALDEAYRIGVEISRRFPFQAVAVVLRNRATSDAEHFTELVAANRGGQVRYFDDIALARSWLAI